jgi:AcrR family transcriptional regulator
MARKGQTVDKRAERHKAILDAALDEFADKGFAGARLEDVAARAGVAKGTIYLYAPSKQALFEDLVRSIIVGPIEAMHAMLTASDLSTEEVFRMLLDFFRREVLGTRRREIAYLVISEAGRLPEVARFYHDEVLARGLALIRAIVARGQARGEIASDAVHRFPQLFAAPMILALVWQRLFAAFDPLDVPGLIDAHVDTLMRGLAPRAEGRVP